MTEPQHAPCEVQHHKTYGECGTMKCQYCGELYSNGQKISDPGGFHYWPDAEYAYYEHCQSDRHKRAMEYYGRDMAMLMNAIPTAIQQGKEYAKITQAQEYKPLKKLLG